MNQKKAPEMRFSGGAFIPKLIPNCCIKIMIFVIFTVGKLLRGQRKTLFAFVYCNHRYPVKVKVGVYVQLTVRLVSRQASTSSG